MFRLDESEVIRNETDRSGDLNCQPFSNRTIPFVNLADKSDFSEFVERGHRENEAAEPQYQMLRSEKRSLRTMARFPSRAFTSVTSMAENSLAVWPQMKHSLNAGQISSELDPAGRFRNKWASRLLFDE